jgi:iron complex outermembrane receptor protein
MIIGSASVLFGLSLYGSPALATDEAQAAPTVADLRELSIEELAQVQVTSVSKRPEPISGAPAAIYLITNEDILRSAATSLPEVLRLAPNLQGQRIDARQHAISARGFNGYETANKMLAMIDGRSIYTTLFSGILWELHHPLLEDIRQIEVVSGPGGTLYGPNAVNGVISISSKSSLDTIGGLARATAAANERTAALRYGVPIGGTGAVRVYAQYFDREGLPAGAAGPRDDSFEGYQTGFRMDFASGADTFTLQGDAFNTDTRLIAGDGERGHNLLARWQRDFSADTSLQLQAYYDDYRRRFILVTDALETIDAQAQFNTAVANHRLVLGAGVRTTKDLFDNNLNPFVLTPERKRLYVLNAFVQDEIALGGGFDLIAGIKLENSSFSGLEVLPNVRLAWQPNERVLLWSSVSRAVRTPSRIDRQLNFLPILATADDFRSEELTAFEAGYRGQPSPSTTLSVSVFYNRYDNLRTTELAPGGALPIRLSNGMKGETWGVEAWATQQVAPWWRLRLGLATLGKDLREKPGRNDITDGGSGGNDPDFKLMARSEINLGSDVDLDFGIRAVDDLPQPRIGAYVEADARLAWRATDSLELYVAGSNLLRSSHEESGYINAAQRVERSVYAGTRVRF